MIFSTPKLKTFQYNLRYSLGLFIFILIVSAFFSIQSQLDNNESSHKLSTSYEALFYIETINALTNEAESAQRGYLITHMPSFLTPFYGAQKNILKNHYKLGVLLQEDKMQQSRLRQLHGLIQQRFIFFYKNIIKDAYGNLNEENQIKSQMRQVLNVIRITELNKLQYALRTSSESKKQAILLALLFSTLGIGACIAFLYKTNEEMNRRSLAEKQLQLKNQQLEQYNTELEQIAYISAHDLKEPLRSIASYSELLVKYSEMPQSAKVKEYSGNLINKVKRLSLIIDALNDFSQIKKDPQSFVKVDCQLTLENIKKLYYQEILQTCAILNCDKLPPVNGIPVQIQQLFMNLIDNAIKFRRQDASPVIEVRVKEAGKMWLFSVKDNGIGIEERYHAKLFKVFHTLHPKDVYQGAGVGLAKCKKIVEFHEGNIWLESKPNEGSVFCFTLPKV